MLFWCDGKRLYEVANLDELLSFLGNGVVHVARRQGFWESTHKYVLGKNHRLKEVPQELYYVGFISTLKKPLRLRTRRNTEEVLANLRVGSKVDVVAGDLKGWYLVRSEKCVMGWMKEAEVWSRFGIMELP